jgi:DNA polymerase elongation subunit (family B)
VKPPAHDPLLYGADPLPGLVAIEHAPGKTADRMTLYVREGASVATRDEPFQGFLVAELKAIADCPVEYRAQPLAGAGPLNLLARFDHWAALLKARDWLSRRTGCAPSSPAAPYLFLNDPVQQHLTLTGRTLFLGMAFGDLRRMQVDIECDTAPGYEFCNAERAEDRLLAIGLGDGAGWTHAISGVGRSEAEMLEEFVAAVRERDPDVIEGHNLFNFDLPYLCARAARHGVRLALGRDGGAPRRRPSRVSFGERTIAYDRFEISGRHVVDTLFLVQAYDLSNRSLPGFGLKEVARHFGLVGADRTYVDGSAVGATFRADPQRVLAYCRDDVAETRGVAALLSPSYFLQAQMLPYAYQNVCVRGTATKIDALMIRAYLAAGAALPKPERARPFAGGYTDLFAEGVLRNVHHCDVRSLYPSLMLARRIAPASDEHGVFLQLLERLRRLRLEAKRELGRAADEARRRHLDALQSTFKILINSFYGYLGFEQARFSDFDAAERVAADGRELLRRMIAWLRERGAAPVEIDTDGIYFVPPPGAPDAPALAAFRREFAAALPEGIEVEFDGEYVSMFSYKMKNYALLAADGEVTIKGAALKSRGLEPFQREFLEAFVELKLKGREAEAGALRGRFQSAIRDGGRPIAWLAKTERLQDSPATYQAKVGRSGRGRNAAYELALRSGREYRAGDAVSYYVTGSKKNVAVHESARLVSEWDPARRDENVAFYLAKLEALCEKFGVAPDAQGELGL